MRKAAILLYLVILLVTGCTSGPTAIQSSSYSDYSHSPSAQQIRQVAPTLTPTSAPAKMWVCVDLAYGYSRPSSGSEIVWQMSQHDGWSVFVYGKVREWYVVGGSDRSVYMYESSLCSSPPSKAKAYSTANTTNSGWGMTSSGVCANGCTEPRPGCDIKGNVSYDTGERIYHVPGQKYYDSTVIRPDYGERWFCTEEEAVRNGWRKSKQ